MADYAVFAATATNLSTNGLGVVRPISATVREQAGGLFECEIAVPMTDDGKWQLCEAGRIIRVPTPVVMCPSISIVHDEKIDSGETVSALDVWAATQGWLDYEPARIAVRAAPPEGKIVATLGEGEQVTRTGAVKDGWMPVTVNATGVEGWVRQSNFTCVKTLPAEKKSWTETIPAHQSKSQLFRIYETEQSEDGSRVTVRGRHIFYDLMYDAAPEYKPTQKKTPPLVLEEISAALLNPGHGFTFYTDVTKKIKPQFAGKNMVEMLLETDTGVVPLTGAELVRDNFSVYLLKKARKTQNRGVTLRYGTNLLGVSVRVNDSGVITRLCPTGLDADGNLVYMDNGGKRYLDSENIGAYPEPRIKCWQVSGAKVGAKKDDGSDAVKTIGNVRAELKEAAQKELDDGCDLPNIDLTVSFQDLGHTEEYKEYKDLQQIFLYDYVRILHGPRGLDYTAQVRGYTYDCLTEQYQTIELGNIAKSANALRISGGSITPGSISGGKLGVGSVDTGNLQNLAVTAATIQNLAVTAAKIADAAVTTAKIGDAQITTAKIADAAVTKAKIGSAAIGTAQIEDAAITKAKIGEAAVGTAQIEDAAITKAKIGEAAVGTAQIDDAAIVTAKIAGLAVTKAKIANAAIDSAKIEDLAVTTAKIALAAITAAQIKDAEISTAKIALGAITKALIAQGAVGTAQIEDASITDAKIVSLNADVITSGTLLTDRLLIKGADSVIYEINAEASGLSMQELADEKYQNALNGTVIVAKSITADQIKAATITANEILAGTITGDRIAAATIEGGNIKAATIETTHIGSLTSGGRNLLDGTAAPLSGSTAAVGTYPLSEAGLEALNADETFTISFDWAFDGTPPPSGKIAAQLAGTDIVPADAEESAEESAAEAGHYVRRFKPTSVQIAALETSPTMGIRLGQPNGTALTVTNVMLERGVTESSWQPSPEYDGASLTILQDSIIQQVNGVGDDLSELSAQVKVNSDSIEEKVSQESYDADQAATDLRITSTEQRCDGFDVTVESLKTENDELSEWKQTWFNAGESGLAIGKRVYDETTEKWLEGAFKTLLSDEKLSFLQDQQEVAYISRLALLITQAAVKEKFTLGGLSAHIDGYAVNWIFDDDAPLVRRNYFAGTATPHAITMASGANYRYGAWISIVAAGQTAISGNENDIFTISYDYKLTNVPSNAPDFRIGMLFYSSEVGGSIWPIRITGGNNHSIISTDGSAEYSGKFETTFRLNSAQAAGTITRMRGYIRSDDGSTGWTPTLTISHLKLEKNNTSTTWVKALEDA